LGGIRKRENKKFGKKINRVKEFTWRARGSKLEKLVRGKRGSKRWAMPNLGVIGTGTIKKKRIPEEICRRKERATAYYGAKKENGHR